MERDHFAQHGPPQHQQQLAAQLSWNAFETADAAVMNAADDNYQQHTACVAFDAVAEPSHLAHLLHADLWSQLCALQQQPGDHTHQQRQLCASQLWRFLGMVRCRPHYGSCRAGADLAELLLGAAGMDMLRAELQDLHPQELASLAVSRGQLRSQRLVLAIVDAFCACAGTHALAAEDVADVLEACERVELLPAPALGMLLVPSVLAGASMEVCLRVVGAVSGMHARHNQRQLPKAVCGAVNAVVARFSQQLVAQQGQPLDVTSQVLRMVEMHGVLKTTPRVLLAALHQHPDCIDVSQVSLTDAANAAAVLGNLGDVYGGNHAQQGQRSLVARLIRRCTVALQQWAPPADAGWQPPQQLQQQRQQQLREVEFLAVAKASDAASLLHLLGAADVWNDIDALLNWVRQQQPATLGDVEQQSMWLLYTTLLMERLPMLLSPEEIAACVEARREAVRIAAGADASRYTGRLCNCLLRRPKENYSLEPRQQHILDGHDIVVGIYFETPDGRSLVVEVDSVQQQHRNGGGGPDARTAWKNRYLRSTEHNFILFVVSTEEPFYDESFEINVLDRFCGVLTV